MAEAAACCCSWQVGTGSAAADWEDKTLVADCVVATAAAGLGEVTVVAGLVAAQAGSGWAEGSAVEGSAEVTAGLVTAVAQVAAGWAVAGAGWAVAGWVAGRSTKQSTFGFQLMRRTARLKYSLLYRLLSNTCHRYQPLQYR